MELSPLHLWLSSLTHGIDLMHGIIDALFIASRMTQASRGRIVAAAASAHREQVKNPRRISCPPCQDIRQTLVAYDQNPALMAIRRTAGRGWLDGRASLHRKPSAPRAEPETLWQRA